MEQEREQFYHHQTDLLSSEILRMKQWSKFFIIAEITSFAMIVLGLVSYSFWGTGSLSFLFSAVFLAVYLLIRRKDISISRLTEYKENLRCVYLKELKYLTGDYSCFIDGEQYVNPHHEFTYDMDIFGPESLFHRLNRTITTGGSDLLAAQLSNTRLQSVESIRHHREAVNELSEHESLRTEFLSHGQRERINTTTINDVLNESVQMRMPQFPKHIISLIVAQCAIWGLLAVVLLASFKVVSWSLPITWASIQFVLVYMLCSNPVRLMNKMVGKIHTQLKPYIRLVNVISAAQLSSKELQEIVGILLGNPAQSSAGSDTSSIVVNPAQSSVDTPAPSLEGVSATHAFSELQSILDSLDRRGNVMGLILFDTFFLTDFFLVRKFIRWQTQYMSQIGNWIDAISRFDALVSMATFRYNEPAATDAELTEDDRVVYDARGLYHPFLGKKAVRNDFSISDTHYYIITGANMAGKSTFLRSVGINYILASCGMPVFAEKLTISVFSLFSSMRTTDDLTHGISYFNAELLRLKQLMDFCSHNSHTLIILDEILKGTNSLDKLNGSRLFLEKIAQLPVTGIIATHDLELSKMAESYPQRFHNYCFEIELASRITYTYKITAGIARNQNATYLLKNILNGL